MNWVRTRLFTLQTNDPLGELLVNVQCFFSCYRVPPHDRMNGFDWLPTLNRTPTTGAKGANSSVFRFECAEERKKCGRQLLEVQYLGRVERIAPSLGL